MHNVFIIVALPIIYSILGTLNTFDVKVRVELLPNFRHYVFLKR